MSQQRKTARRIGFAAALWLASIASAFAQQFPTVPSHSVIGRIGNPGDTGPAQAIPFATLQSVLAPGVAGPGTPTVINDFVLWNNGTGTLLKDAAPSAVWGTQALSAPS